MTITRNNKTYTVEIERVDCWNNKVTVYEMFEDGTFSFVGKAISNDVEYAINEIIG